MEKTLQPAPTMTQAPDPKTSPPEPPAPNPEQRFVQQRIVQPLIQWMPLGGSSWLLVSFLLKQEWAQVVLTFPVTVVTAVWAAYSKNFVDRLSEIYAEKGKQDADAFSQSIDSLKQALTWQLSGFDAKYLRCQRLDCQEDDPVGIKQEDGIFTPLLQEVFVPLRLSTDSVIPGYAMRLQTSGLPTPEDCPVMLIWDLLRVVRQQSAYRQIAIRAWGGYGKTTLLKHLAYSYGGQDYRQYRAPKLVPFLLYLARCWQEITQKNPPNLPELLTQYHLPKLPQAEGLVAPPRWALNLLKQGNALVMFDGFDEVPAIEREAVSAWISEQMRQYGQSVFIVTSRPTAYTHDYTARRPTASFWVERFNQQQRQRFVEQWYLCQERYARGGRNTPDVQQRAKQNAASLLTQIAVRPELEAIAGNALLLNMMARFHRDKQGAELPDRKVELYQDICELQLGRRPKAKGISLLLNSLSQRQEVLQIIALAMMQRAADDQHGFKQIQRDDLLTLMAGALSDRDPDVPPQKFLAQIVQISELLVEKEGDVYEFAHLSFQEFLAASEIARLKQENILYEQLGLDAWKPTILFYASLVNPTHLIRAAIHAKATDLAYQIFRETPKPLNLSTTELQELEALKSTVQTSRYQQLEEYLRTQQWKAADQETYRLMITTVGKEEGQYFEAEELLNFPCEELRAIDQLWVTHSNGRFGFSVQKQIYVECGAKLDGKYPGKEIWNKFGDRVGWRINGEWQYPKDPSFSSPQGIFPFRILVRGVGGAGRSWFSSLAQRLVNCSTSQS